jgi:hypothetical protein
MLFNAVDYQLISSFFLNLGLLDRSLDDELGLLEVNVLFLRSPNDEPPSEARPSFDRTLSLNGFGLKLLLPAPPP